ncbi:helix-turn-helix transcriptional regulator [Adhaeribacter terreus]|uniref:Helix-turn-helix transcriptional regulator n=1 Tax=Adhaeribacter terreus TaxID=529703 RepID=A0ABW0EGX3_9BACT
MKNHVKAYRNAHNLTQSDFAERIAVSRQTVHAIETGKFVPSTVLALKIAKLFNASVETIFELESDD